MAKQLKSVLSWSRGAYVPSNARLFPEKDLRGEYSRLRAIANKRIAALGRSQFADSAIYQRHAQGFPRLKDISDPGRLPYLLNSVARYLESRSSSVTGQRSLMHEQLETLHRHGYTFVNEKNFRKFTDFMEATRAAADAMQIPSDEVVEWLEEALHNNENDVSADDLAKDFAAYLQSI